MTEIVDTLIYERAPWIESSSVPTAVLESFLKCCLNYNGTLSEGFRLEHLSGKEIFNTVGNEIARHVTISDVNNTRALGPALIVENHPTDIADAIVLDHVLKAKRPDLYFFANSDVLRVFPQLDAHIDPVEWRKEKPNKSRTQASLAFIKKIMGQGRLGVIFPSGRFAKITGLKLVEQEWMISAVAIAKKYDVAIVPVHISARNSYLFYLFDMIHTTLRDIALFRDPRAAIASLKSIINSLGCLSKTHRQTSQKGRWKEILIW